ncbi:hypothetical protein GCM10025865_18110 [Paraoerskovia sediminicola]|uniref:LytR/CpsA/Psr regulator C-terminal domain-containing protein n=1 Tax=Paraoerskovia sediminicola TaxID=1138587 RepID=A0ABM8G2Y8_9CELL|nr:LytR C-terminal domain-containing protein [Paraoerskovia sediminicola]BDZ42512.1 hypothetical protein GCM10025865_18110 [Paraoerskovia sediminicola]
MSTPERQSARARRRRHEHERQAVVFGVIIAGLAVVGVGALAVYTGAVDSPFDEPFYAPASDQSKLAVPCVPDETMPVPYADVHVNVLNASGDVGIARITGDLLTDRGFTVDSLGNADETLDFIEIATNAEGLPAAYTLAAQFETPAVVLDDRAEPTVDVLVGSGFSGLVEEESVGLEADTPLVNLAGCVPVDEITPRHLPTPEPTVQDDEAAEE